MDRHIGPPHPCRLLPQVAARCRRRRCHAPPLAGRRRLLLNTAARRRRRRHRYRRLPDLPSSPPLLPSLLATRFAPLHRRSAMFATSKQQAAPRRPLLPPSSSRLLFLPISQPPSLKQNTTTPSIARATSFPCRCPSQRHCSSSSFDPSRRQLVAHHQRRLLLAEQRSPRPLAPFPHANAGRCPLCCPPHHPSFLQARRPPPLHGSTLPPTLPPLMPPSPDPLVPVAPLHASATPQASLHRALLPPVIPSPPLVHHGLHSSSSTLSPLLPLREAATFRKLAAASMAVTCHHAGLPARSSSVTIVESVWEMVSESLRGKRTLRSRESKKSRHISGSVASTSQPSKLIDQTAVEDSKEN